MIRVRRAIGRIAVCWLMVEVVLLAAAPASIWLPVDAHAVVCTCAAGGDHAICPLHHDASVDSKFCLMRNADEPGATMLSSVFGMMGFVTGSTESAVPVIEHPLVLPGDDLSSARPSRPDSPPPRV